MVVGCHWLAWAAPGDTSGRLKSRATSTSRSGLSPTRCGLGQGNKNIFLCFHGSRCLWPEVCTRACMAPAGRDFVDSPCGGLCVMNPVCGNQREAAKLYKDWQTSPPLGPVFLLLWYTTFHQTSSNFFFSLFTFLFFLVFFPYSLCRCLHCHSLHLHDTTQYKSAPSSL